LYVTLSLSTDNFAPESEIEVDVLISSEEEINAFDISLEYPPESLSLVKVSAAQSVASVWKSFPLDGKDGLIYITGGMVKPFTGERGKLITLVFKARNEGISSLVIKKAKLVKADGFGTTLETTTSKYEVVVKAGAPLISSEIISPPPKIKSVFWVEDSETKNPIAVIKVENTDSVRMFYTRFRSWLFWGKWQNSQFIVPAPKYAWAAQFRAIDYDGRETSNVFYRWDIIFLKLFSIFASLALIITAKKLLLPKIKGFNRSVNFFLILFLLPITLLLSVPNKVRAATISISPASNIFSVDSTFDAQIMLDTEGQSINAVDIYIIFPADIVQVISPTMGKSAINIWTSPIKYDNQKGEIILRGGIPEGINTSHSLISTISFRVRQAGTATIKFQGDSKVLLNDGRGTDVLRNTQSAVYEFILPPPTGPVVTSETHMDQTRWYANSNAVLRWNATAIIPGYSFILNEIPIDTPDDIVDSTEKSVVYKDLLSGTYYFHIKALGKSGVWGGITHFALNVDVNPPAKFPIEIKPGPKTTNKEVLLFFNTTDAHSGLDHYEQNIVPLKSDFLVREAGAYGLSFFETNPPKIVDLNIGKYDVIVRAYDRAGNFTESTERVQVISPFVFYVTNNLIFIIIFVLFIILLFYSQQIYRWYKNLSQKYNQKTLPEEVEKRIEELKNYRKKYGAFMLLIGIFSNFLLFTNTVSAQQSAKLHSPLITTISRNISNEDIFYVGGKTDDVSVNVIIYLQNLSTEKTTSYPVIPDKDGNWFYRHPSSIAAGEYLLWAQTSAGKLLSSPSNRFEMSVSKTAIQIGASRISFQTLYLCFILIFLTAIIILSIFIIITIHCGRKKHAVLMKETKEAEESIKRGFAVLKRDVEAELAIIHKVKSEKQLSEEEKQKEGQLTKDLSDIEEYVGKEVWDIEKNL